MANASARTVDFSGVKDGGAFNRNRIPAGDYIATIIKVEDSEAKSDQTFQYLFSIKIDKHPSRVIPYYCKLTENQLWKLRNLLIAAGKTVPKKKMKLDPSSIVGKKIGVTIEDDEYEGREQSQISGVFPASELVDGNQVDDDNDEPEDDEDEAMDDLDTSTDLEDDEDEEEADPLADLDRAALKALLVKQDPSFKARKSQTDDDLRDLLRAAPAEDDEDEDEEEPEPEPAPKKKAKPAAKPAAKKKAKAEVTDEELEELDIDDL